MLKLIVCIVVAFISQAECEPYSNPNPYPDPVPQRQCRTGYCNVNSALRNEGFYPSTNQLQRVGVYPGGCNTDNCHESEENHQPPPPAPPTDKSLPVSVCVQIPPETALRLPKCVLQQIVYALTKNDDAPEPTPTEAPCTPAPPPCTQSPAPCTKTSPLPTPAPPTTTPAPVPYPSLSCHHFKPSGYCGSCRSSLTPRYNQS